MPTRTPASPVLLRCVSISDAISKALSVVAALAVIALLVNVVVDVVGRFFFNSPINGTLELVSYWWMPVASLLAFAEAERRREHIRVTVLVDSMSDSHRRFINLITGIVLVVLVSVVLNFSFLRAMADFELRRATSGGLAVPVWPIAFVACVALAAFLLQLIASTIRSVWKPLDTVGHSTNTSGAPSND